jgi:hypothetical protein
MLDDVRTLVRDQIRDNADRVDAEQVDRAIALAVIQLDQDRPCSVVRDVVSAGGYMVPVPTDANNVIGVEYPINRSPPAILTRQDWAIYAAPAGAQVQLAYQTAANSVVRMTLNIPHVLDDSTDTITPAAHEAVASYAAAILLDQMSAATSSDIVPTIAADTVNPGNKPDNFASRARTLRQRYYDLLGIDPKRVKSASTNVRVVVPSSTGGRRLTHNRRRTWL